MSMKYSLKMGARVICTSLSEKIIPPSLRSSQKGGDPRFVCLSGKCREVWRSCHVTTKQGTRLSEDRVCTDTGSRLCPDIVFSNLHGFNRRTQSDPFWEYPARVANALPVFNHKVK